MKTRLASAPVRLFVASMLIALSSLTACESVSVDPQPALVHIVDQASTPDQPTRALPRPSAGAIDSTSVTPQPADSVRVDPQPQPVTYPAQ